MLDGVFGPVLTAIVTPFRDGRVDEESFARLLHHLVANGSDGVVVAGTTGEASTLTDAEQVRLFEIAVSEVGGQTRVIAGAGANDTAHAVRLTQGAFDAGCEAVLSVTPYYNKPPREGLRRHFAAVAAVGLPVILYNIPGRTALNMPPDVLAELAEIPGIVAVKQANEDLDQSRRILAETDLVLYAGNDDLLGPFLEMGGAGVISVASHLVGGRMQEMVAAALAGDLATMRAIDGALQPLYEGLFTTTNPILIKAALQMVGLIQSDELRLPLVAATEAERSALRTVLDRCGIGAGAAAH